jgi:hypothetical protein
MTLPPMTGTGKPQFRIKFPAGYLPAQNYFPMRRHLLGLRNA